MKCFFRKINLSITLLLITSAGIAYGDYSKSPECGKGENYNSCSPAPCGKEIISIEALYWRAFEGGLDTCIPEEFSDIVTSDGIVISRFNGRGRDPNFTWNPGFRVGIGYEFDCSNWDIGASWTHFYSHAHDENNETELRWNVNFDVIDIIAGYEIDLSSCFSMRTFVGLRGAKIDQVVHINEFDLITIDNDNKEKLLGIGPLIGLEAEWNIGCGFSVYTNVSTSWLYGHYDVKLSEFEESEDTINFCEVKKELDASLASADAGLGIRCHKCLCGNLRVLLQLGLEHHRYFDYNRIKECSDLSFDGVNLSFGISF
jgi:hypothetical protein